MYYLFQRENKQYNQSSCSFLWFSALSGKSALHSTFTEHLIPCRRGGQWGVIVHKNWDSNRLQIMSSCTSRMMSEEAFWVTHIYMKEEWRRPLLLLPWDRPWFLKAGGFGICSNHFESSDSGWAGKVAFAWCFDVQNSILWSFLESYSKLSSTTFSQGQTASTQVAAPWRLVCNESAHWSICQTPHCQYVSSDPRIPVFLKKKFGETVYFLFLISLSIRRTISQRQFSPIIIVIQTPYHLLHLYHSAFPEGRDMIAPSWTPTRLSEINLKGFDLHKIILSHWSSLSS